MVYPQTITSNGALHSSTVATADGSSIALHQFSVCSTDEADIVFLWIHANGFNANTYRQLLGSVANDFAGQSLQSLAVVGVDQRSHGMSKAVLKIPLPNWRVFVDDVAPLVRQWSAAGKKVIVGGHSMGGQVTLQLAVDARNAVTAVYVCDPVLIDVSPIAMKLMHYYYYFLGKENPSAAMVERAKRRRSSFASKQDIFTQYQGKGGFKGWSDQVLQDYIDGGAKEVIKNGASTWELACAPHDEAEIFNSAVGNDNWPKLATISCPIRLVTAEYGSTTRPKAVNKLVKKARAQHLCLQGGAHLFPMTHNNQIAADLTQWLQRITAV